MLTKTRRTHLEITEMLFAYGPITEEDKKTTQCLERIFEKEAEGCEAFEFSACGFGWKINPESSGGAQMHLGL